MVNNVVDKFYRQMPVAAQHLMISAYGLYWNRIRFGGVFEQEVSRFREREYFTSSDWRAYVTMELRSLLASAIQSVPYYQEHWAAQGIEKRDLHDFSIADLKHLPVLEKDTVRANPSALLRGGKPAPRHMVFHTSGSTGTPITTYWLPGELQKSLALREARSCGFAEVSYKMPRATFSGRIVEPDPESSGPFYRYNSVERQVYFSAFHLRPETVPQYISALERHHIQWMTGYSHSIYQLAQLSLEKKIKAPELKAVITTSEPITLAMKDVIQHVFQTKVYEEYGAVEDLFYVCECKEGRLHINPDAGIIEVVDQNMEPVPPGEMGELLVTGFIRPSQPMIRYRIGDLGILGSDHCPCGREMPILKEVLGRVEDTIYGPDGRRMVRFHGIFIDQPHIKQGQIIQKSLDRILVRVIPTQEFDDTDRQSIVSRIQQRLTDKVEVEIELVSQIERTNSGKFRAVINQMTEEEKGRIQASE